MALSDATRLADFATSVGTTSALYSDASNDRVGIGTTTPTQKLDVVGVITATAFGIGISSAGTSIATEFNTLNFVGTGNTFKVTGNTIDVAISGGSGGGASKVYNSTIFAYDNVVSKSVTIESPYRTASIWTSPDVTVDIEDGVTVTVDEGCLFQLVDI